MQSIKQVGDYFVVGGVIRAGTNECRQSPFPCLSWTRSQISQNSNRLFKNDKNPLGIWSQRSCSAHRAHRYPTPTSSVRSAARSKQRFVPFIRGTILADMAFEAVGGEIGTGSAQPADSRHRSGTRPVSRKAALRGDTHRPHPARPTR